MAAQLDNNEGLTSGDIPCKTWGEYLSDRRQIATSQGYQLYQSDNRQIVYIVSPTLHGNVYLFTKEVGFRVWAAITDSHTGIR